MSSRGFYRTHHRGAGGAAVWGGLPVLLALVTGIAACGDDSAAGTDAAARDAARDAGEDTGAGDAGPDGGSAACEAHDFFEVEVPLADGHFLAGTLRRATAAGCRLPTLLVQTPYNKEGARALWLEGPGPNPLFESRAYAVLVVDWRGFYGSAAAAVSQPDYGADGFDVVEWIAAQPWSDGQVGTWGVSALGRVQHWTAAKRPPHLVAAVPIFCAMNTSYEEYYPGGVLRREFSDSIALLYGANVVEEHPLKDFAWTYLGGLYRAADVAVPMLLVAGWYDLDNERSFRDREALVTGSESDVRGAHRMLVGPWHHFAVGGENTGAGRPLTPEELLYHDAERRVQEESLVWFDHWMRGVDSGVSGWAPVRYRTDGEQSWEGAEAWPPAGAVTRTLYLGADGSLGEGADSGTGLTFDFDPADPSPTVGGQTLYYELLHGPQDQAEVLARDDHLVFVTPPLSAPLRLVGPGALHLGVATTGLDTDLVVRVTDVDPQGGHRLLTDGVRRLSLREGYGAKSAVEPGTRYSLIVPLTNQLGVSLPVGHRLGIVVSSASWPRFARNPGTGDDFYDQAASPLAVTNTIFCDAASRLEVTVLP